MLGSAIERLLPAACALALLAGSSGLAPAAADWRVSRWAPAIGGATLASKDRRFSLGLSCRVDRDRLVSHDLFLSVPRRWMVVSDTLRVTIDGVAFELEVGGSEDGVSLSNVVFGNSSGVSRELAKALLSARTIVIEGPPQKGRLPASTLFEAGGTPQANAALDGLCTSLGAWAAPTGVAQALLASAAAQAPLAPQAPAARITANRYVFDAIKREPWGATWRALTERSPRWLKTQNGPAGASTVEVVDGVAFEHFDICMAHACDETSAEFLFSGDGLTAYGVLVDRGSVSWLGSPPAAIANRLASFFPAGRRPALPSFASQGPAPAAPVAPLSAPRIIVPPMTPLVAPAVRKEAP